MLTKFHQPLLRLIFSTYCCQYGFSETSFEHPYASGWFASTEIKKSKTKSSKHTGGKPPIYTLEENMSVTFAENSLWWHDLINVKKPIKVDSFQSVISGPEKRTHLSNLGKEEIGLTCRMQAAEFHYIILMSSLVTLHQNHVLLISTCKEKTFHRPWSYRLTQSLERGWGVDLCWYDIFVRTAA